MFLRLISLDLNEENPLNSVELMEGRPLGKKTWKCGWTTLFAANNLELNDEITVLIAGKGSSSGWWYGKVRSSFMLYAAA